MLIFFSLDKMVPIHAAAAPKVMMTKTALLREKKNKLVNSTQTTVKTIKPIARLPRQPVKNNENKASYDRPTKSSAEKTKLNPIGPSNTSTKHLSTLKNSKSFNYNSSLQ